MIRKNQMEQKVKPIRTKLAFWLKRLLKWTFLLFLSYIAILLIGLFPVNNDFKQPKDGIEILIVSNAVHADIIVPKITDDADWRETFSDFKFGADVSNESHVAFGWGDRGFFLETETWDDFKLSTAANALLLPSDSCMHVSFTRPEYYPDATSVTVSPEQYRQLVVFINDSFNLNEQGNPVQIEGYAYSSTDAFFHANGRYHLLNTCNSWVGRGLKTCGVRTPWLSPMPKSPMLYIKSENAPR